MVIVAKIGIMIIKIVKIFRLIEIEDKTMASPILGKYNRCSIAISLNGIKLDSGESAIKNHNIPNTIIRFNFLRKNRIVRRNNMLINNFGSKTFLIKLRVGSIFKLMGNKRSFK